MANKDLLKQAIAEAKSVREAAIANAKEALEETLTPHLKDMLAAKLQEMEEKDVEEEVVNEVEKEVEEGNYKDEKDEAIEELNGFETVGEAEDDSEESEDEVEAPEEDEAEVEEPADEEPAAEDEDLSDLSVEEFKDMIRDIIAQELGHEGGEAHDDMDAGDIEGMGDEAPLEEPAADEEEIDLDELLRELDAISEGDDEEMEEGTKEDEPAMEENIEEDTNNQIDAESDNKDHNVNRVNTGSVREEVELKEALETIETLKAELQEVNLLNSKLLYVNKIFKANSLSEAQKVNVIAAFDKAETVKEVKLVYETVAENVVAVKKETVTESKLKGMASKATGTTASKPEVISEASEAVRRMQVLAGIIKN